MFQDDWNFKGLYQPWLLQLPWLCSELRSLRRCCHWISLQVWPWSIKYQERTRWAHPCPHSGSVCMLLWMDYNALPWCAIGANTSRYAYRSVSIQYIICANLFTLVKWHSCDTLYSEELAQLSRRSLYCSIKTLIPACIVSAWMPTLKYLIQTAISSDSLNYLGESCTCIAWKTCDNKLATFTTCITLICESLAPQCCIFCWCKI